MCLRRGRSLRSLNYLVLLVPLGAKAMSNLVHFLLASGFRKSDLDGKWMRPLLVSEEDCDVFLGPTDDSLVAAHEHRPLH